MEIYGRYQRTLWRDERTGQTAFTFLTDNKDVVLTEYGNIVCNGIIPRYAENTPLSLTVEERSDSAGRHTYIIQSCSERVQTTEDAVDFLSGPLFRGIGPQTARQIVSALGDDVFAAVQDDDAVIKLSKAGVHSDMASQIVRVLKSFREFRELLALFVSCGGTYEDAYTIRQQLESSAMERICAEPYLAAEYGVPYRVCEAIAKKYNTDPYSRGRLRALVLEAVRIGLAGGNTALPLDEFLNYAGLVEKRSDMGYSTPAFFLGAEILSMQDIIKVYQCGSVWYIANKDLYDREISIRNYIERLCSEHVAPFINEALVKAIESETGILYAEEQRQAFSLFSCPGIKILTGGPGTGKTTTSNGLIRYFEEQHPGAVIRLCSPTANAAKRMRETTGRTACTAHKLLGLGAVVNNKITAFDTAPLNADLIVLDEASMVDTDLLWHLLSRLRPGTTLLLVGDEDQLESVGPGDVLGDLIRSGMVPVCRLKKVYRQAATSSIIGNAIKVREGDTDFVEDKSTEIIRVNTSDELVSTVRDEMKLYYDMKDPWKVKLMTPVKAFKYSYSTVAFNKLFQECYNHASTVGLLYGGHMFRVGDPVFFCSNNYASGYINGDTGIIKDIILDEKGRSLCISSDNGTLIISGRDLADVALAYAGTVHKAQGGECDTSIVVVPKRPANMLTRKLIYVAITRAKKKNVIISEGDALETAVGNKKYRRRHTNLSNIFGTS